jgi:hypothetical protein
MVRNLHLLSDGRHSSVRHIYNRPIQKCSLSDPRRALINVRFLGILVILGFCHRECFLFK